MGWNGLDLQNELAALLGDTSTSFKAKVLSWINDIENDISIKHDWPFLKQKGQVKVVSLLEEQKLSISSPSLAPSVSIDADGALTAGSSYKVKVSFYESSSEIETIPSVESSEITADALNKKILLTAIPVSTDPLVTARKIYLSKDGFSFYLHGTISDNTTTTYTILTETTDVITPIDFDYFKKIDGSLFIESSSQLRAVSAEEIRNFYPGDFLDTAGTPTAYAVLNYNRIITYPVCNIDTVLSFYYSKYPRGICASVNSIPTIPRFLKEVLYAGVEWKGYQYRDRSGKETVFSYYNSLLTDAISRMGKPDRQSYTVRDVVGDADGFVI